VRGFYLLFLTIAWTFTAACFGEEFRLTTGETLTGELLPSSANDAGVQVKVGEGEYKRIPWASFSQEDLRKFAQNKKMETFVEPFIEVTQEEKLKKTEIPNFKQPERLERVAKGSVIGAFFGSGLGLLILLLLYAANLYAAYEIAIFRAQPMPLVCGISAILPLAGPIIFLSMPTRMQPAEPTWDTSGGVPPPAGASAAPSHPVPTAQSEVVNPMQGDIPAAETSTLKLAHEEPPKPAIPTTTTFQRGQFTFNRRFIETKFPGFFGVVRRDAEKDLMLLFKTSRGKFAGRRITRIAANDLHLEIQKDQATEEVMIPFIEIQEIQLKHKDAP
jgi:hypothetical protein